ncbi:MAG: hypothetical protein JNK85_18225 [Verrucomicrobiales bacterium]|nr:hypothetical protein [Verrucomicrobiales bacterium]
MKAPSFSSFHGSRFAIAVVCISSIASTIHAQTSIESFEYATGDDLVAAWQGSPNAIVSATDKVAPTAIGKMALQVQFNFPSVEWTTEFINGPELPEPVAIGSEQYLSFRIKGDPAFLPADFKNLYLYAYDDAGNFGRWGTAIPTTDVWQIFNFPASAIEKPWNSTELPDLGRIVKFAFYQYGSQAAIEPYTATIAIDELTVRDTPLSEVPTTVESVVEAFEYATDEDLVVAWKGSGNAIVTRSDSVAPRATGKSSMQVEFHFGSSEWATETVTGSPLAAPIAIGSGQYLTLRIKGDPAFAASDFKNFYLYAYDEAGNFGRWGAPVPTTTDWEIFNFNAANIEKPWDSPGLPDLGRIVRFSVFQYGSQAALEPYTATIHLDELMVRNTPLSEFPLPSAPRALIDDFESYSNDTALLDFYSYLNSPATTATTATLATPAPQGSKALQLAIDFAAGQYPWGSVRSPVLQAFSLPTNAVVTVRVKGDPNLASVVDDGTSFWLSFYDKNGQGINYVSDGAVVASGDWTTLEAKFSDFNNTDTVDVGNLVRWRILVQGWTGTAESAPLSATFQVDDIRIGTTAAEPPQLAIARDGSNLVITLGKLVPGKSYELRSTANVAQWPMSGGTTVTATGSTATVPITPGPAATFFKLVEK